jgi:hypothetical protein
MEKEKDTMDLDMDKVKDKDMEKDMAFKGGEKRNKFVRKFRTELRCKFQK